MMETQSESPASVLRQYVDGRLTIVELDRWLSESEYDDSLSIPMRNLLATIGLVVHEVGEGLAEKDEILTAVALALASLEPSEPVISQRSSSNTSWNRSEPFTADPTPVVRGHISVGTEA